VTYNVRTPADYEPTVGHPLIVVYSPAGVTNPAQTEQFTGLTTPATSRGYVITYVNHVSPASQPDIQDVALVPELVVASWCIDTQRTYLTGHSDGGSMAWLMALYDLTTPRPAAIAPSAAGVNSTYLAQVSCSTPLPVMILHSSNDSLFPVPTFGFEPAEWFANCNGCSSTSTTASNGCQAYSNCPAGAETQYCQGTGSHGQWPPMNTHILDFFDLHSS